MQETRGREFHPWVGTIPWRRKWQPTPVVLPRKPHGGAGGAWWATVHGFTKELDVTEPLTNHMKKEREVTVRDRVYMDVLSPLPKLICGTKGGRRDPCGDLQGPSNPTVLKFCKTEKRILFRRDARRCIPEELSCYGHLLLQKLWDILSSLYLHFNFPNIQFILRRKHGREKIE